MAEDRFDAIVVGAGMAGSIAAYVLAQGGAEVLVIERGNYAGSKNVTGGRLYAHSLEKVMPGFAKEAPVERKVTHEKVSFLTDDSAVTLDYHSGKPCTPVEESYTVLRSTFDQWLMEQAEGAGAQLVAGVRVDDLHFVDGKVAGVVAGGDVLEANVVILADGVNSMLGEKLGMVKRVSPHSVAVGAKEVIELPQAQLEDRFNVGEGEGVAWLFAGSPSNGLMGGGFLYTNRTSISLGVVCGLHNIGSSSKSVPQMMEDFKQHPAIRPLIKGGKMVEYSAHVVPEGGLHMLPQLIGDGVLIVGDAAGMCLNVGYTIRGMDLAVASAEAAAKAVLAAKEKGDFSAQGLGQYQALLDDSFVMKDMKLYKNLPPFLENRRIFNEYPQLAADVMHDLFAVDGQPAQPLLKKLMRRCKEIGYLNLIRDGMKGVRAL